LLRSGSLVRCSSFSGSRLERGASDNLRAMDRASRTEYGSRSPSALPTGLVLHVRSSSSGANVSRFPSHGESCIQQFFCRRTRTPGPKNGAASFLVHEMAHVKRFDALTQLLAQISVAVFWFDPLVWIAAHQMRVEREHACDDYVLRDGTARRFYAGELLEWSGPSERPSHDRAAPAFAALAMARRSEFEGRMLAILDPRLDRHTLTRRGTLMTALIVALLTLPLRRCAVPAADREHCRSRDAP